MTQKENILLAIENLNNAIDTFPDKDDFIRRQNGALYGMIDMLKIIINDLSYDND